MLMKVVLLLSALCLKLCSSCCSLEPSYQNTYVVTCNNVTTPDQAECVANFLDDASQNYDDPLDVVMSHCNISVFYDGFFNSFNMAGLEMSESGLTSVPYNLFDQVCYQMITGLRFYNNKITQIPSKQFQDCSQVTNLDLSGNQIADIQPDSFDSMFALQSLYLHSNNIKNLTEFRDLRNLLYLVLNNNPVEVIPFDTFGGLNSLQSLEISSLAITTLQEKTFNGLPDLRDLDVTGDPFYCNCSLKWFQDWILESSVSVKGADCAQPMTGPIETTDFCPDSSSSLKTLLPTTPTAAIASSTVSTSPVARQGKRSNQWPSGAKL